MFPDDEEFGFIVNACPAVQLIVTLIGIFVVPAAAEYSTMPKFTGWSEIVAAEAVETKQANAIALSILIMVLNIAVEINNFLIFGDNDRLPATGNLE